MPLDIVKYSPGVQKFFPQGASRGHSTPNVNLGPPKILETTRARKLKLKHAIRYSTVLASSTIFSLFLCQGAYRGHRSPNVNLRPPNISETTSQKVDTKITIRYGKVLALSINIFFCQGSLGVQDPLLELQDHLLLSGYYQRWEVEI